MAAEPVAHGIKYGVHSRGRRAVRKAHMPALRRLPTASPAADFVLAAGPGRHEGVVARVEHQGWNADAMQVRVC